MKKLFVLFLSLIAMNASAQFHLLHQRSLSEAINKKLIVILKSPTDFGTKDKDLSDDPRYQNFSNNYNEAIREVFPKYWTLTKGEILFKTSEDVAKMSAQEQQQYLYVHSGWVTRESETQGELDFYNWNLDFLNAENKRLVLYTCSYYPDSLFTNADVIFFIKTLNNHVEYTNKNYEDLKSSHNFDSCITVIKTKTLLIDKSQSDLTPEDLKKDYEYKAELVSPARIQEEIEKGSDEYLFVKLVWGRNKGMALYSAFDTKTCTVIGSDGTGGVAVKIGTKPKEMKNVQDPITGTYNYKWVDKEGFGAQQEAKKHAFTVYKSPYRINMTQIKYFDSKLAQKSNFK